jgi:hypothetical protein
MAEQVPLPGSPAQDHDTVMNNAVGTSTNRASVNQRLRHHESVMDNMAIQLQQIQAMLSALETRLSGPPPATAVPQAAAAPPASSAPPAPVQTVQTPAPSIGAIASRELAKRTFTFAEDQQLSGPENFEVWKQGLNITFRAIGLAAFTEDPSIIQNFSDADLAVILMILRDSCAAGPKAMISWHTSPIDAYKLLLQQYAPT